MKRIKLEELKDIMGRPMRTVVRDDEGNAIREPVLDTRGEQVVDVIRDKDGNNIGLQSAFRLKTKVMSKQEALPEMLMNFYMGIPADHFTRRDALFGNKLAKNIDVCKRSKNGYLELDEDVHDWLKEKMKDEKVGVRVLGTNLAIIEEALDDFERLHEPAEKLTKGKEK